MRDQYNFSGDFRGAVVTIETSRSGPRVSLAEALERFSDLPLDGDLPAPAPLPSGSVMAWPANPMFVARTENLRALAKTLSGQPVAAVSQTAAASGLGGIGKTQIAVEFAHRYGQFFAGGVFWINCEDGDAVPGQIAACGGVGRLELGDDFEALTLSEQLALVQAAWSEPVPRLLIFDNCESEGLLTKWRPKSGGARVLLTSRRHEWSHAAGVATHLVDVFARAHSIKLLASFHEDLAAATSALNDIAEELGDLPLALHMAGAFMARYRHVEAGQPAQYLNRLRSTLLEHPSLTQGDWSPTGHDQHVARTFALSFDSLDLNDPVDRGARQIFDILACYAPGVAIPRSYVRVRGDEGENKEELELGKEDAIRRLSDLGLIDARGENLFVHRLISAFVNSRMDEAVRLSVEAELLEAAAKSNFTSDSRYIAEWDIHLFYATERALARNSPHGENLLHQVSLHHYNRGDYKSSQETGRRRLAIVEAAVPRDVKSIASALNDLAVCLRPFDPDEAAKLLRRSIELEFENPDASDLKMIVAHLNLGEALVDIDESIAAFEEALRRFQLVWERPDTLPVRRQQSAGGVDGPMGSGVIDEQAHIAFANGNPDDLWIRIICGLSRRYGERNPKRGEKFLVEALRPESPKDEGFRHWQVLESLGIFRNKQGDSKGARAYLEAALKGAEAQLGHAAPVLGDLLYLLAVLCDKANDNQRARVYFERAFDIALAAVGWDHPATQACSNGLHFALTKGGDFSALKAHMAERLAYVDAHDDHGGQDLPHILFVIGLACAQLGERAKAESYWKRGLLVAGLDPTRHRDTIEMTTTFLAMITGQRGAPYARPVQSKRRFPRGRR